MIKAIEIASYGSIHDTIRLPLGHVTLLHGANGSGKSMICNAIALALTPEGPLPMLCCRDFKSRVKVTFEFAHPTLGTFQLQRTFGLSEAIEGNDITFVHSEIRIDGTVRPDISILSGLLTFIYLSSDRDPWSLGYSHQYLPEDRFFHMAARFLGFTDLTSFAASQAVIEVLKRVNQRPDRAFRKIEVKDGRLFLQHWHKDPLFPYLSSGSGDKVHLLSDFYLEAASLLCQYRPVLLILDDFPTKLVSERFADRYRQLSSPNIQVIMTTHRDGIANDLGADLVNEVVGDSPNRSDNTKIAGIQLIPRPMAATIQQVIESYSSRKETEFIDGLVLPALRALGFQQVSRIPHHGVGEHGFDIPLFYKRVFPGRVAYFGAQVKTGNVGSRSSGSGTIGELIDQLKKMLTLRCIDPATQLRTSADYAVAIIAGRLSPDAQRIFDDAFEGDRRVVLWDAQRFASVLYEEGAWPNVLSISDGNRFPQAKDSRQS